MKLNTIYIILSLAAGIISTSCIKNDIPYPKVHGDIITFEVKGQVGQSIINAEKQTIDVAISDTVDLSKIEITKLEVSNDAVIKPEMSVSSIIDLTQPYECTLTTYQEYLWTIKATQHIERYITIENQTGETIIDAENKKATLYVIDHPLDNINILTFKLAVAGATVTPNPAEVKDFTTPCTFTFTSVTGTETWTVEVLQVAMVMNMPNAFAKYAFVSCISGDDTGTPTFEYKQDNASEWVVATDAEITKQNILYSTKISGLTPNTRYNVRATSKGIASNEITFITEEAPQIPNLSFDDWHEQKRKFASNIITDWFPNKDSTAMNWWWDCGNRAANTINEQNPTKPETDIIIKGTAAKLKPTVVAGTFAAGSLYLGKFDRLAGFSGAEIDMGRPFTARPKALKGYYNYTPGIIDKTKNPYAGLNGEPDSCHIYIILADWEKPFHINTSKSEFIDLEGDDIIAYAELIDGTGTNNVYKEFELELEYRDMERKPAYIVIVSSSCKYGDYFTGSTNTLLYIDEFELVY